MRALDARAPRAALVYHDRIVADHVLTGRRRTLVVGPSAASDVQLSRLCDDVALLTREHGGGATLRLTREMAGCLRLRGVLWDITALWTNPARAGDKVRVGDDGLLEVLFVVGDWAVVQVGELELVLQFVVPPRAIRQASALGGVLGGAALLVRAAASPLGLALLVSLTTLLSTLFVTYTSVGAPLDLERYGLEASRPMTFSSYVEEIHDADQPEPVVVDVDAPDVASVDAPPAPALEDEEEGGFGEEDKTEPSKFAEEKGAAMVGERNPSMIEVLGETGLNALLAAPDMLGRDASAMLGPEMESIAALERGGAALKGWGSQGVGLVGMGRGGRRVSVGRIGGRLEGRGPRGKRPVMKKRQPKRKPVVDVVKPPTLNANFCKPADIRRVVRRRAGALRNCYERQLLANPSLSGQLSVSWKVMLDGRVKDVTVERSTLDNGKVERCVARVVKRMRFSQPEGGICVIKYPITFQNAEQ